MTRTSWLEREVRVPNPRDTWAGKPLDPMRLWICATCFKVSQAERKPKYHQRRLRGLEDDGTEFGVELTAKQRAERLGFQVLEVVLSGQSDWDNETGTHDANAWSADPDYDLPRELWQGEVIVACGPFEAWTAFKVGVPHQESA